MLTLGGDASANLIETCGLLGDLLRPFPPLLAQEFDQDVSSTESNRNCIYGRCSHRNFDQDSFWRSRGTLVLPNRNTTSSPTYHNRLSHIAMRCGPVRQVLDCPIPPSSARQYL